jgi:hypothetical protein
MSDYGTSDTFPRIIGEHNHVFCFDQDPEIRAWQIAKMKARGCRMVRDNFITGAAKYKTPQSDFADDLFEFYTEKLAPDFIANDIIPLAVLCERNWTGDWLSTSDPPVGLSNGDRATIVTYVEAHGGNNSDNRNDYSNRIAWNLATFGSDGGTFCSDLRAWLLDFVETFAAACPPGTYFQVFNGPETTRVCGQFNDVPWDFTPDAMHTVSNANPGDNRSWASSSLSVTMPTVEQDYIDLELAMIEDVRDRIVAAGHPRDRLIGDGLHFYMLSNMARELRCLGASDPNDYDTIPENAVFTEVGVGRYPDVHLDDSSLEQRPALEFLTKVLLKVPRAIIFHSMVDARFLNDWISPGGTAFLWSTFAYCARLRLDNKKPGVNVAYPFIDDELFLGDEFQNAVARFYAQAEGLFP